MQYCGDISPHMADSMQQSKRNFFVHSRTPNLALIGEGDGGTGAAEFLKFDQICVLRRFFVPQDEF